ncbi:radical SAM protein [Streptomyces sp. NPDC057245]|uniref:radical SAM protein n=1 Tax=Streptomyces TaxID=1883 RepID=UPI001C1E2103|nr:radical SAM protein [Streptomyces sp. A108]MBU6536368.1 radical SAM protein [Streptomyces sp. A108]
MTIPTLSSVSPPETDWTALRNFAALRGQFRVSLTPLCNEACWFCHNEGDVPPPLTRLNREARPRPGELTADDYTSVLREVIAAGLKRVYFTGGEPLLSALARPVLTDLPDVGADGSYTLITNGSLIRRNASWLATAPLDKVKVSLHYFSDESLFEIAGVRFGIGKILDGIDAARDMFERVELNTLLQRENKHEVLPILDYALERRLPVQFIELVDTDFNTGHRDSAVPSEPLIDHLRTLTSDERTEIAGVGQGRRVFRIDGVEVDIIQRALGRHHVGQCGTCPLKPRCVEGFWSLRMDHAGGIQPCLLRDDLRLDIRPHLADPGAAAPAVARHLSAFTEGTL